MKRDGKKQVMSLRWRMSIMAFLAIILMGGLWLRVYRLNKNVPSLYGDEAAGNYESWVIFNDSKASSANKFQLAITSYSWFLGLTPLAARLPSALYGSLAIVALFAIAKVLSGDNLTALLTAVLGTVVPWLFMLSRISFAQMPIVIILVCLHVYLYARAASAKNYLVSLVPLVLAAYFYPSLIIISPFVMALTFLEILRIATSKQRWVSVLVVGLLVAVVVGIIFWKYDGLAPASRGIDLAIWRDVNVTADSNLYRGLARLSSPTIFSFGKPAETLGSKIAYNLPGSILGVFSRNYLSFFSPDFLFFKGDTTLRQSTGMTGSFFLVLLPFMVYGLYLLVTIADKKVRNFVLLWVLVSPIPGAITKDGPGYLLRVVTMMPFLTYLSALGMVQFLRGFGPRLRLMAGVIVGGVILYSAYSFLFGYFQVYPALAVRNYEYGFKELSDFQLSRGGTPMLVIWDGYYPNSYFRFWQKTPFGEYANFKPSDITIDGTVFHKMFPNLYFSLPRTKEVLRQFLTMMKIPYWAVSMDFLRGNPEYRQSEKSVVQVVRYPDQTDDFVIYKSY